MRFLLAAVAAALLVPASASACACCADEGYWSSTTRRLSAYELGELDRVRFSSTATTYVGAAGLDGIEGIRAPSSRYRLVRSRIGRRWTLLLTAPGGERGRLSFVLPRTALVFAADLRDGRTAVAGGPLLYKEWRLEGGVRGAGVFLPGIQGAKYRLILHGRGTACPSARDFTHWTLRVAGGGARFTLFGSLRR